MLFCNLLDEVTVGVECAAGVAARLAGERVAGGVEEAFLSVIRAFIGVRDRLTAAHIVRATGRLCSCDTQTQTTYVYTSM